MSRFDFLHSNFTTLYDKCVQAEEATDVNFKMLMVRQSLEYIVRELGERGNDLFQSISNLSDRDILGEDISDLFHETRMLTNRGVHGQSVSARDAQTAIDNLVDIAIWYASKHKKQSFQLAQFSAEDISRAKQYIKDDSFQGVSQVEYLAVDVDPLATVGTFQTTWSETTNPLEKDVFETEAEYEKRIAQMEPVRIGYGVLDMGKKDGYTNVQFLQHHIERSKVIQFVKAPVYFFVQNAPVSGVIDGEIVARLRVHDHKVCCDYSRIYLRNGERNIPIRFLCWQKTDYETDADYRKRVEALPILPLGLCMPIRSRYDIEKQQLPFETKRFAYVPFAIPSIYTIPCDRELAKRACMQREPFAIFGNITLNGTMERAIIRGKEIGIIYDNEKELKEQRKRESLSLSSLSSTDTTIVHSYLNVKTDMVKQKPVECGLTENSEMNPQKQYEIGIQYRNNGNYIEAIQFYQKAANQGYVKAIYMLGFCYEFGYGISKSIEKSIVYYQQAASLQYEPAIQALARMGQHQDAKCHQEYEGYEMNPQKQYEIGVQYRNNGNFKEAVKCFREAAEQGNVDAQYCLGNCLYGQEAVWWYRKAAEQGHAQSQYRMGYCYRYGIGVISNLKEALKWYRKAAEQGHAEAQNCIDYFRRYC